MWCHPRVVAVQTGRPAVVRAARVTAAATIAFSVALLVVAAIYDRKFAATGHDEYQLAGTEAVWITAWLASAGVGAILLVRRPSHPVGWLFAALSAIMAISGASDSYAMYGLFVDPGSLPGAEVAAVLAELAVCARVSPLGACLLVDA